MDYKKQYLKYKLKYLTAKKLYGSGNKESEHNNIAQNIDDINLQHNNKFISSLDNLSNDDNKKIEISLKEEPTILEKIENTIYTVKNFLQGQKNLNEKKISKIKTTEEEILEKQKKFFKQYSDQKISNEFRDKIKLIKSKMKDEKQRVKYVSQFNKLIDYISNEEYLELLKDTITKKKLLKLLKNNSRFSTEILENKEREELLEEITDEDLLSIPRKSSVNIITLEFLMAFLMNKYSLNIEDKESKTQLDDIVDDLHELLK